MEPICLRPFRSSMDLYPLLVWSPFRSAEMSSFQKVAFMVSFPPSLQMSVRRRLRALSRDALRASVAMADEVYTKRQMFNISGVSRWKFCDGLMVDRKCMFESFASIQKLYYSRREDYGDSYTIPRACSSSFKAYFIVQAIWDGYRLAYHVVYERAYFLVSFISGNIRSLPLCRFRAASIAVNIETYGIRTAILPFSAKMFFLFRYCGYMRWGIKGRTVFDLYWRAWKGVRLFS